MGNSFTGGVARRSGGVVKILIVDDSKAMRMIVSRVLRQAGYGNAEFVEASNGAEGLAAARAGGVDLILSDWNMPEMNGIEFLERAMDIYPGARRVLLGRSRWTPGSSRTHPCSCRSSGGSATPFPLRRRLTRPGRKRDCSRRPRL